MTAIRIHSASKSYPVYISPSSRLVELLTLNRAKRHRDFWALRNVSVDIERGETFCIVGSNGSGKSTLLQLIAGILSPSVGDVSVHGRVAALIELGAGFNPEFTGRQNVLLAASLHGMAEAAIRERLPQIEAFADIGEFIDQPVRSYSSGMLVRLAFSVAIHVDPDILLVDEALAVGDTGFRQRCLRRVEQLRERGTTILFVSHSMADVRAIGHRAMWLERGRVLAVSDTASVLSKYLSAVEAAGDRQSEAARLNPIHRHGSGAATITQFALLDRSGRPLRLMEPSATIFVRITLQAREALPSPTVGFVMRNHLGMDFCADSVVLQPLSAGSTRTVEFEIDLPHVYPAHFSFSPYVAQTGAVSDTMCDWIDNAITVEAAREAAPVYGYIHVPCRIGVNASLGEHEHRVHR